MTEENKEWQPQDPNDLWNIDAARAAAEQGYRPPKLETLERQIKGTFLVKMPDGRQFKNLMWYQAAYLVRTYRARSFQTAYVNPETQEKRTLPKELREAGPRGEQPPT